MLYKIRWKSYQSGHEGCGSRSYPKDEAKALAEEMSRTSVHMVFWAEPVPSPTEQNDQEDNSNTN